LSFHQGKYSWPDGSSYDGGWINDKKEGKGNKKSELLFIILHLLFLGSNSIDFHQFVCLFISL